LDHTAEVRAIVAKNIKVKGEVLGDSDIVFYDVTGCNARRRRKTLASSATITVGFSTASAKGLDADGFYDAATESLKESITSITADFEAACGCTVTVDTIKVELSTLVEEAEEEPETRDLHGTAHKAGISPDNTGNQQFATKLPWPSAQYYAGADCPNGCSGHGACSTNGCVCWPNWGNGDGTGGACDQRICPYEIAWVDTPSAENKAHALRECAGRGICDRTTGDCDCFPGYEGKGCRRTVCPNDCSGHGTCEYLSEMRTDVGDGFKWTGNLPTTDKFQAQFPLLWDAHKTRGCKCDAKWSGLDCSVRMCPRGDYPQYFALQKKSETQAIIITNVFTPATDRTHKVPNQGTVSTTDKTDVGYKEDPVTAGGSDWGDERPYGVAQNGEFALTFRSTLNEEFTTITLNAYNLTEEALEDALNSLPNKVIEDAHVTLFRNIKFNLNEDPDDMEILGSKTEGVDNSASTKLYKKNAVYPYTEEQNIADFNYTWYANDLVMLVTYAGSMTQGDQYALECKTAYCSDGCQPKLQNPLDFRIGSECIVKNNYENSISTNWECSGRGECSTDGVCQCYQGYTDEYCSTRTAII